MSRLLCSLMLALSVALLALSPTAAFANNGWDTTSGKGNSDTTCSPGSPGCTTVSQPPGQVDTTSTNNSPKSCTGPKGQCK